jgi:hypothetical protein
MGYSLPVDAAADYEAAWQAFRTMRRRSWLIFLGGPPAIALVCSLAQALFGKPVGGVVFGLLGVSWFLSCAVASVRLSRFRCPRCGRAFTVRGFSGNPSTDKCLHCGLRVGEVPGAVDKTPS